MQQSVVVLVLVSLLTLPAVPAVGQSAGDVAVDLEGTWRFTTGDDPSWADPDFDDRDWAEVQVPQEGGQAVFADYDGFAWFRLSFDLPADAAGVNLVASLGFIDDADVSYLNGVEIGRTGALPPDEDSQWFERRLYPVPADVPVFGGRNVLAVRMNDFSGGGGWYRGPVGLFSKAALREAVHGITGPLTPPAVTARVTDLLAAQARALAVGDVDAYLATLDAGYVHDGRDRDRRRREVTGWLARSDGSLVLDDAEVEVVAAADGRVLVDTNRTISGTRDGQPFTFEGPGQQFLVVDPASGLEIGNRSRFFRDHVDSSLEGRRREHVVYLPPSYYDHPTQRYPVVYLLHGINGGSREWEPRDIQQRLDRLFSTGGLAESIVVMPDGESLWYIDSSVTPWRSMFVEEMVPQVDADYRTLADRRHRGVSGVSMGGHGAFTIGWAHPELFGSIASHMGALSLPPLVGTADEVAANTPETPLVQAVTHTPDFLDDFAYYFDACADDDFRFGEAVQAMAAELAVKQVPHTAVVFPDGRHNDACWLPHIDASFGLHSTSFRSAGLQEQVPVRRVAGADRVSTAVALVREAFAAADTAVVAGAGAVADALTAGPLAVAVDGPLLLTGGTELDADVEEELTRLGVRRVYLVGGPAAVAPAVVDALEARDIDVIRVAGADRYTTATAVAAALQDLVGPPEGAVLARGDTFADALAASNVAATGPHPILLTPLDRLDAAAATVLEDLPEGSAVTLAGGTAALAPSVADAVTALGLRPDRRAGGDRYGTAVALLEAATDAGADPDPLLVSSGTTVVDALVAGPVAAALGGGLLLVDPADLDASAASAAYLAGTPLTAVLVAGGPMAVEETVRAQIASRAVRP